jgi:hypothetical protein
VKQTQIVPTFVDDIPERLDEGRLYVSHKHSLAIHLCCCGCRGEVVTPFSPAEWRITARGGSVSLSPSIGNWGFPCRSHYWIRSNRIEWALPMTERQIEAVRAKDRADLKAHVAQVNAQRATVRPWWSIERLARRVSSLFRWRG